MATIFLFTMAFQYVVMRREKHFNDGLPTINDEFINNMSKKNINWNVIFSQLTLRDEFINEDQTLLHNNLVTTSADDDFEEIDYPKYDLVE